MLSEDYPVSLACDVLGCGRSSYYYQSKQQDETEIKAAIDAVAAEWPTYGYRRVTAQLRRQGRVVNHKRVRRLMALIRLRYPKQYEKSRQLGNKIRRFFKIRPKPSQSNPKK